MKKILLITLVVSATQLIFSQTLLYRDSLKMDIYMPQGDTSTSRPVILLSHSGSFLPQSFVSLAFQVPSNTLGTKKDSCMIELCKRFAKRGYVAISFDYRVGWNALAPTFEERTDGIINAVYKAMHDAKSLIRFLKLNAATYGIDPNKIVLGGSNSGAYVGLLAANLNKPDELDLDKFKNNSGEPFIDTLTWGNYEGKNGTLEYYDNAGPSSDFQLVLSLGGCVGDTSWIDPGETPILAFHGTNDGSPFGTGIVVTGSGQPVIEVSGPRHYIPITDAFGNQAPLKGGGFCDAPAYPTLTPPIDNYNGQVFEASYPFYGVGFEPWGWYAVNPLPNPNASRARAMAYIDTIMSYGSPRIYKVLIDQNYTKPCGQTETGKRYINEVFNNVTTTSDVVYGWAWSVFRTEEDTVGTLFGGINDKLLTDVNLDIFPNPSVSDVTIRLNDSKYAMKTIEVYDVSGKLIKTEESKNEHYHKLSHDGIQPGIHFINVKFAEGGQVYRRVIFE